MFSTLPCIHLIMTIVRDDTTFILVFALFLKEFMAVSCIRLYTCIDFW